MINLKDVLLKLVIVIATAASICKAQGQVNIDTISSNYEKTLINGQIYFLVVNKQGDTLKIKQSINDESNVMGIPSLEGARRINEEFYFANKKLLNRNVEEVCPIELNKIYGMLGSTFLVNIDKKLYILDLNCNLKFIDSIGYNSVQVFKNKFLTLTNKKKLLNVYNHTGDLINHFKEVRQFYAFPNGLIGIKTTEEMELLRIFDFFKPEGEYVATSYGMVKSMDESMAFKKKSGEYQYYFDDKKYDIPKEMDEVTLMPSNLVMLRHENGLYGLYNNKLEELLSHDYRWIYYIRWDHSRDIYNLKVKPDKDIIAAVDSELNLKLIDLEGNLVKLEHDVQFKLPPKNVPISAFNIEDQMKFYVIQIDKFKFHLYDSNFNFVAIETKDSTDRYFLDQIIQGLPAKSLRHFINDRFSIDFIETRVGKVYQRNILDRNFNPLFEKDLTYIRRIDEEYFIISRSFTTFDDIGKKGKVVKLSYN